MPWFFPEFLKKRACRYLLQHYLGQFLEEKISLDDLTIDLYNGTGAISNVPLNVEAINDVLQNSSAPLRIHSGYIGKVTIHVPWTALLRDSCKVEIRGLFISVVPQPFASDGAASMTDSLFFSMTTSHQLAEEVLKSSPPPGEEEEESPGFEGMEALAKAIEQVLSRVEITMIDTSVQLIYTTPDITTQYFLRVRAKRIEYFDELSKQESSVDGGDAKDPSPRPAAASIVKVVKVTGVSVEMGSNTLTTDTAGGVDVSPSSLNPSAFSFGSSCDDQREQVELEGVPILLADGESTITVKLKQTDESRLDVDMALGCVHLLLSPSHVHMMAEMVKNLAANGSSSSDRPHPGSSRPISQEEKKSIETQLAREERAKRQREDQLRADPWSRRVEDSPSSDSEETFYSFDLNRTTPLDGGSQGGKGGSGSPFPRVHSRFSIHGNDALHAGVGLEQLSGCSRGSGGEGRASPPKVRGRSHSNGPLPSAQSAVASKAWDMAHDPLCLTVSVAGATIALLQTDAYLYTAPFVPGVGPGEEEEMLASVDEGGVDPSRYLRQMGRLLAQKGVNRKALQTSGEDLAQLLPRDHFFFWFSTFKMTIYMKGPQRDLDISVASAELWEYLYINDGNPHITTPVAVNTLVQLVEDLSDKYPSPCLKVKLVTTDPGRKKPTSEVCTSIEVAMATLVINMDLTLLERLQPLLTPPPPRSWPSSMRHGSTNQMKYSLYMTSSNFNTINAQRQAVFNQAIATGSLAKKEYKFTIRGSCKLVDLSLKFPVVDLSEKRRPPLNRSFLHPEVLYISLADVVVTHTHHSLGSLVVNAEFNTAKACLSRDGIEANKEVFLIIDKGQETSSSCQCSLEEIDMPVKLPSPFSGRKSMYSTRQEEREQSIHAEELVTPGTRKEMEEFEQYTVSRSRIAVTCTIPSLRVHLPGKEFLEILFNRFGYDLLLWQPANGTAEKSSTKSMFVSCVDDVKSPVVKDTFRLCTSTIKRNEDEEEEEEAQKSVPSQSLQHQHSGFSLASVSFTIQQGQLTLSTAIADQAAAKADERDDTPTMSSVFHSASAEQLVELSPTKTSLHDGGTGLVLVDLAHLHLFTTTSYLGENGHDFVCLQLEDFTVHHMGAVTGEHCSCLSEDFGSSCVSSMHTIVRHSTYKTKPATGNEAGRMVAVAMESTLNTQRNTKTNKCAVGVYNSLVHYYVTPPGEDCFVQLANFLVLKETVIPGYDPPSVITELHVHVDECSLEYRPLYCPWVVVLCVDSVNMATSIVTGSPLLVLRVMLDNAYVFLANKKENIDLQKESVCVVEVDLFDLTLRVCSVSPEMNSHKLFTGPEIALECSNNNIHIRTCVDSCVALRDLAMYVVSCGDLYPQLFTGAVERTTSGTNTGHSPPSSLGTVGSPSVSEQHEEGTIGDLMFDAMVEDIKRPSSAGASDEAPSHRAKTSTTMKMNKESILFADSDDEDEEEEGGGAGRTVTGSSVQCFQQMRRQVSSDDEFQIVTAPTSTGVSPGSRPVVKCLLGEGEVISVVENHFSIPDHHTGQLHRPKHFPEPVQTFTLKEMSVVWHMYGGRDFGPPLRSKSSPSPSNSPKPQRATHAISGSLKGDKGHLGQGGGTPQASLKAVSLADAGLQGKQQQTHSKKSAATPDWKAMGGPGRDPDALMEIELNKFRVRHETFPSDTEQASRLVFLIKDLEIRDRLAHSRINKFLHLHTSETLPHQSHANMVTLKVLLVRPEHVSNPGREEAQVLLSLLPLRLNIDQEALFFMVNFFKELAGYGGVSNVYKKHVTEGKLTSATPTTAAADHGSPKAVFIKSFVFQPDVPIRIDYEARSFDTESMGTFAGILLGLSCLDCSEVKLKSISLKNGILGWDKLTEQVTTEWLDDIRTYQIPRIIKGVGPMHHVAQLFQGVVDLVWMPVQHGVAVVELTSRALQSLQSWAQMAYDLVAPSSQPSLTTRSQVPPQPADLMEGMGNAYTVVAEGIGETARNLYTAAAHEHEEKGFVGAMGGVLMQLPGTVVKPIIVATEATRHVLGGVKYQFVPDARQLFKGAGSPFTTNSTLRYVFVNAAPPPYGVIASLSRRIKNPNMGHRLALFKRAGVIWLLCLWSAVVESSAFRNTTDGSMPSSAHTFSVSEFEEDSCITALTMTSSGANARTSVTATARAVLQLKLASVDASHQVVPRGRWDTDEGEQLCINKGCGDIPSVVLVKKEHAITSLVQMSSLSQLHKLKLNTKQPHHVYVPHLQSPLKALPLPPMTHVPIITFLGVIITMSRVSHISSLILSLFLCGSALAQSSDNVTAATSFELVLTTSTVVPTLLTSYTASMATPTSTTSISSSVTTPPMLTSTSAPSSSWVDVGLSSSTTTSSLWVDVGLSSSTTTSSSWVGVGLSSSTTTSSLWVDVGFSSSTTTSSSSSAPLPTSTIAASSSAVEVTITSSIATSSIIPTSTSTLTSSEVDIASTTTSSSFVDAIPTSATTTSSTSSMVAPIPTSASAPSSSAVEVEFTSTATSISAPTSSMVEAALTSSTTTSSLFVDVKSTSVTTTSSTSSTTASIPTTSSNSVIELTLTSTTSSSSTDPKTILTATASSSTAPTSTATSFSSVIESTTISTAVYSSSLTAPTSTATSLSSVIEPTTISTAVYSSSSTAPTSTATSLSSVIESTTISTAVYSSSSTAPTSTATSLSSVIESTTISTAVYSSSSTAPTSTATSLSSVIESTTISTAVYSSSSTAPTSTATSLSSVIESTTISMCLSSSQLLPPQLQPLSAHSVIESTTISTAVYSSSSTAPTSTATSLSSVIESTTISTAAYSISTAPTSTEMSSSSTIGSTTISTASLSILTAPATSLIESTPISTVSLSISTVPTSTAMSTGSIIESIIISTAAPYSSSIATVPTTMSISSAVDISTSSIATTPTAMYIGSTIDISTAASSSSITATSTAISIRSMIETSVFTSSSSMTELTPTLSNDWSSSTAQPESTSTLTLQSIPMSSTATYIASSSMAELISTIPFLEPASSSQMIMSTLGSLSLESTSSSSPFTPIPTPTSTVSTAMVESASSSSLLFQPMSTPTNGVGASSISSEPVSSIQSILSSSMLQTTSSSLESRSSSLFIEPTPASTAGFSNSSTSTSTSEVTSISGSMVATTASIVPNGLNNTSAVLTVPITASTQGFSSTVATEVAMTPLPTSLQSLPLSSSSVLISTTAVPSPTLTMSSSTAEPISLDATMAFNFSGSTPTFSPTTSFSYLQSLFTSSILMTSTTLNVTSITFVSASSVMPQETSILSSVAPNTTSGSPYFTSSFLEYTNTPTTSLTLTIAPSVSIFTDVYNTITTVDMTSLYTSLQPSISDTMMINSSSFTTSTSSPANYTSATSLVPMISETIATTINLSSSYTLVVTAFTVEASPLLTTFASTAISITTITNITSTVFTVPSLTPSPSTTNTTSTGTAINSTSMLLSIYSLMPTPFVTNSSSPSTDITAMSSSETATLITSNASLTPTPSEAVVSANFSVTITSSVQLNTSTTSSPLAFDATPTPATNPTPSINISSPSISSVNTGSASTVYFILNISSTPIPETGITAYVVSTPTSEVTVTLNITSTPVSEMVVTTNISSTITSVLMATTNTSLISTSEATSTYVPMATANVSSTPIFVPANVSLTPIPEPTVVANISLTPTSGSVVTANINATLTSTPRATANVSLTSTPEPTVVANISLTPTSGAVVTANINATLTSIPMATANVSLTSTPEPTVVANISLTPTSGAVVTANINATLTYIPMATANVSLTPTPVASNVSYIVPMVTVNVSLTSTPEPTIAVNISLTPTSVSEATINISSTSLFEATITTNINATLTSVPMVTANVSLTPTPIVTANVSFTPTPTVTANVSTANVSTANINATLTSVPTVTANVSFTPTPTVTANVSTANVSTANINATLTSVPTVTANVSFTPTPTVTANVSTANVSTANINATLTSVPMVTANVSFTPTPEPTVTANVSTANVSTANINATLTSVPTVTANVSFTPTPEPTVTANVSTANINATFTSVPTVTANVSFTPTPEPTVTANVSTANVSTANINATLTSVPTVTANVSFTPTPEPTVTANVSTANVSIANINATLTSVPTVTANVSFTPTPTVTANVSTANVSTANINATLTSVPTVTANVSFTPTPEPTVTANVSTANVSTANINATLTSVPTVTANVSFTPTPEPTVTANVSTANINATLTSVPTVTANVSFTPTPEPTVTANVSTANVSTANINATLTSVPMVTANVSFTPTPEPTVTANVSTVNVSTANINATLTSVPMVTANVSFTPTPEPTVTANVSTANINATLTSVPTVTANVSFTPTPEPTVSANVSTANVSTANINATLTSVPMVTANVSFTPTPEPTVTANVSTANVSTANINATLTSVPTVTANVSFTPTPEPTVTANVSTANISTANINATLTSVPTVTANVSFTPTPTVTANVSTANVSTANINATLTSVPTVTANVSFTPTPEPTVTANVSTANVSTANINATLTSVPTVTANVSFTPTPEPTVTANVSTANVSTANINATLTSVPTVTANVSFTPTPEPTVTANVSTANVSTANINATFTSVPTVTANVSFTLTPEPTVTANVSTANVSTANINATLTSVPMVTANVSFTPTPTVTANVSTANVSTANINATLTSVPMVTVSVSLTPEPTVTANVSTANVSTANINATLTSVPTVTANISLTPTPTVTANFSLTPTPTVTANISLTPTPTNVSTANVSTANINATLTSVPTVTANVSLTPTPTVTANVSLTPTSIVTANTSTAPVDTIASTSVSVTGGNSTTSKLLSLSTKYTSTINVPVSIQ
ncbi:hypothetical protein EMCRGX_G032495 [Ephydatia muelleri]